MKLGKWDREIDCYSSKEGVGAWEMVAREESSSKRDPGGLGKKSEEW